MSTVCPYCNIEVSESAIEAEDGCCPECGSMIIASSLRMDSDDDDFDEYEDGVEELEFEEDEFEAEAQGDLYDDLGDGFDEAFDEDFDDDARFFEESSRKRR